MYCELYIAFFCRTEGHGLLPFQELLEYTNFHVMYTKPPMTNKKQTPNIYYHKKFNHKTASDRYSVDENRYTKIGYQKKVIWIIGHAFLFVSTIPY